jgi:hypothetical protein
MNNDCLGLHYRVIDLDVISLGDGQWHCIRDFRRDSPTDRSDAGNSNDGTRQDIRENGTATHCNHEFSSFVSRRIKPELIQIQIALPINRGIHPRKSGFLPINSRARHRHSMQVPFGSS